MNSGSGSILKNYSSIILLLVGIVVGSIAGAVFGKDVEVLKPIGDVFLNLLFTAVVPLVFFVIASAIAELDKGKRLGRIIVVMSLVFLSTILISAIFTIIAAQIFPVHETLSNQNITPHEEANESIASQLAQLVTATDFYFLLSRKSMLALLIFSILVGAATLRSGEEGKAFRNFLKSGSEVMKHLLIFIMKLAPIGLGAYFAYQVGVFGPQLFGTYAHSMALYYGVGIVYFIVFFTLYAFVAGGTLGIKTYWKNNIFPSLTALGTCSSIATIPANLQGGKGMGVPDHINNVVVPLGATLHKDGSSISSIVKMVVVFAMFGKDFTGMDTIALALGITVLVSLVEGGIPNGGYIGEVLFISIYNFPPEALPVAMVIGTLVDPLATLLNATGDTVCGMLVTRFTEGKDWLKKQMLPAA